MAEPVAGCSFPDSVIMFSVDWAFWVLFFIH